jgi:hypothetical protein
MSHTARSQLHKSTPPFNSTTQKTYHGFCSPTPKPLLWDQLSGSSPHEAVFNLKTGDMIIITRLQGTELFITNAVWTPDAKPILCLHGKTKTNFAAFTPQVNYTDRRPLVGEVTVNFWGRGMSRGQRNESLRLLISVLLGRSRYFSFK